LIIIKNGVFETTEQKLFQVLRPEVQTYQLHLLLPTTALAGPTRMSISMKYNAAQTACETFHMVK
jgi:hypothetical protein